MPKRLSAHCLSHNVVNRLMSDPCGICTQKLTCPYRCRQATNRLRGLGSWCQPQAVGAPEWEGVA
jgi:hypothetical protein